MAAATAAVATAAAAVTAASVHGGFSAAASASATFRIGRGHSPGVHYITRPFSTGWTDRRALASWRGAVATTTIVRAANVRACVRAYRHGIAWLDVPVVLLVRALIVLERVGRGRVVVHRCVLVAEEPS